MSKLFDLNVKEAINAFIDEDRPYEDFIGPAIFVYNAVVDNQTLLKTYEHPYLLGLFYSRIEGAFRDNPLGKICFENSFYCYMRCIEESESIVEKRSAAMRMFLLMYDNGYDTSSIAYSSLEGTWEHDWKAESRVLLDKVKQHCFCIFHNNYNQSLLDDFSMNRLKGYVKMSGYLNKEIDYLTTIYSWNMMRFYLQDELKNPTSQYRFEKISEYML